jgi:hypothetical protein
MKRLLEKSYSARKIPRRSQSRLACHPCDGIRPACHQLEKTGQIVVFQLLARLLTTRSSNMNHSSKKSRTSVLEILDTMAPRRVDFHQMTALQNQQRFPYRATADFQLGGNPQFLNPFSRCHFTLDDFFTEVLGDLLGERIVGLERHQCLHYRILLFSYILADSAIGMWNCLAVGLLRMMGVCHADCCILWMDPCFLQGNPL